MMIPKDEGRTSDEERVTSKHRSVVAVLEEEADAVLSMARRVQCLDIDPADGERLAVTWCLRDLVAVPPADHWNFECLELDVRNQRSLSSRATQCCNFTI